MCDLVLSLGNSATSSKDRWCRREGPRFLSFISEEGLRPSQDAIVSIAMLSVGPRLSVILMYSMGSLKNICHCIERLCMFMHLQHFCVKNEQTG